MDLSSEFSDLQPIWNDGPLVIAGPCSAETEEQMMATAKELVKAGVKIMRAGIWKPRTRPGGFEGAGDAGLEWFKEIKRETGLKVATEVATVEHVEKALNAGVDLCWIGARTSGDPFAVQAIADVLQGVDIPVLIKNPMCPDLKLWLGALERIHGAGIRRLGLIHRGFFSVDEKVYRNSPMWEVIEKLRNALPHVPVILDPSHMGGKREFIKPLSQEAIRRGYNGFIIESHCQPDDAWTDAAQQVCPSSFANILEGFI